MESGHQENSAIEEAFLRRPGEDVDPHAPKMKIAPHPAIPFHNDHFELGVGNH
jgi:hypothetical protein